MTVSGPAYRKAFDLYMRTGTPIGLTLKATHPTSHYIWRTRGDGRVRPEHQANDGKIFAWGDPPPTGTSRRRLQLPLYRRGL